MNRKNQRITKVNRSIVDSLQSKSLNLLLSCGEFAYFESDSSHSKSYYRIPYYGCQYHENQNDSYNSLGWADVILIPTKNFEKYFSNIDDYDKIDSVVAIVNKMTIDELKRKFRPIIFLIEKKYLHYIENSEINYYPKLPYIKKVFEYDDSLKNWILSDSIEIYHEIDDLKWVNLKLEKTLKDR